MTTNKIIDNEMPDSVSESKTARLNHPWLVLVILFIVAFITEQIFFDHKLGLQWPIFIALLLSAVTAIVIIERVKVPVRSLWLFFPILLLTILGLFRSEAFTIAGLGITTVAMLVWLAAPAMADAGFQKWVRDFRATAASSGVSGATFDRAFRGISSPDPEVLELAARFRGWVAQPEIAAVLRRPDTVGRTINFSDGRTPIGEALTRE